MRGHSTQNDEKARTWTAQEAEAELRALQALARGLVQG
jgi:hypothetical protein